jgi:serine/threonine protein kinase
MDKKKRVAILIGSGSHSRVYCDSAKSKYCKKVCIRGYDPGYEMDAMVSISHSNVIAMIGHYFDLHNRGVFVFKRYSCDLNSMKFDDTELKMSYTLQILSGLNAIHKAGWFHRDISVYNILVDTHKQELVISDFGWAKEYRVGRPYTLIPTPPYALHIQAPEILFDNTEYYTEKIDIWAVGCVIYFIYANRRLFEYDEHIKANHAKFLHGQYDTFSTMTYTQNLVWEKMMIRDPKERISAKEALLKFH